SVALIGPGLVGAEFLSQLLAYEAASAAAPASRSRGPAFSVVAVANSSRALLSATGSGAPGLNLGTWKADLATAPLLAPKGDGPISALVRHAAGCRPCVVVDCTSSDAVAAQYPDWLRMGLHVVTPNKKGFSGPVTLFDEIQSLSGYPHGPYVFHESTVGAGLPIISTLNDLVRTGDEIIKIEGIFSGTLSFIFNNFSTAGKEPTPSFSSIVSAAKEKGYTEPDPRDDLNGMDVARKVVILGRVAGVPLSLDTLSIENVVPAPLRAIPTSEEFMHRLPEYDAHFEKLKSDAAARGEVLRCVGVVDPRDPTKSCVKLVG
ncbi:hypothetical protein HK405_013003, partial [Cladochytrium tenue]